MDYFNNISFIRKLLLSLKHIIFRDLTFSLEGNRVKYNITDKFDNLNKLLSELDNNLDIKVNMNEVDSLFESLNYILENSKNSGYISHCTYQLFEDIISQWKIIYSYIK